jgi:hypothetical protein
VARCGICIPDDIQDQLWESWCLVMRVQMLGYLISNTGKDKVAVHIVKRSQHDQKGGTIFGLEMVWRWAELYRQAEFART